MKKIGAFFKKLRAPIPAFCYTAALCIALLTGLFNFGYDAVGRMTGRQQTMVLAPSDFELVNMEMREDGMYLSTTDDPQLLMMTPPTQVRRISMQLEYDRPPYERCVYFTKKQGDPFSAFRRVWPQDHSDGITTVYELPVGVKQLRIDPGSLRELVMDFGPITLNPPRAFWTYFMPDGGGWFYLAVIPGLCAAALEWLIECKRHYSKHKERKQ